MAAQARLLWPLEVDILRPRRADIPMDEDFREPAATDEDILLNSRPVRVSAQVSFSQFEDQAMRFTGDDQTVVGYLIITERDQGLYDFKANDKIVAIHSRNTIDKTPYRITHVRPRAQKAGSFGLYKLDFKEDAGA